MNNWLIADQFFFTLYPLKSNRMFQYIIYRNYVEYLNTIIESDAAAV